MKSHTPIPPKLANHLLRSFLRDDLAEEVTGDLEEKFYSTLRNKFLFRAQLNYWFQVVHYLRPFALRKSSSTPSNRYDMFQSYFKIGWRNLLRSKAYSTINITGLAIGLTCAMAIGLFIWDEYSYDRFHQNAKYIYRVVQQQKQAGEFYDVAVSPGPLGTAMKADFPEVVDACLTGYKRSGMLQQGRVTVESAGIIMADHRFFQMFDFPLVLGNAEKVLSQPNQVIITEEMASNLFGLDWRMNPELLGKSILLDKGPELILVGVAKDLPTNSHIQFEVMLAYDPGDRENNWRSNNYHTYVQLDAKADPSAMKERLSHYITKYWPDSETTFSLQPLTDIYLHSDFDFQTDWSKTSSILYIRVFFAVGAVVLLIALFNFINLSTARAIRRAKEVGIRKTVGAFYRQLMTQFLCESLLMTAISVVLALVLLFFGLPLLNGLSSKSLFVPFNDPRFVIAIIAFTIVMSVLSGLYPSVYLSNFQPIKVLKGVFDVHSGHRFRQILVVCQFTFSVVLAVGAIVIYQQLSYMQDKNLGFDQSQLIYLGTRNMPTKNNIRLKHELKKQSSIVDAASASNSLIDNINSTLGFEWEGQAAGDEFLITLLNIDPDYIGTTGMKLIAGRDFDYGITGDTASCVINETAARRMGWTSASALGKWFDIRNRKGTIIGVVQDFHFRPMTAAIEPLVFMYRPDRYYDGIMVKTNPSQVREAIATIERLYKNHEPNTAAHYSFVDEQLERQYRYEQRTGKIVLYFSLLAIFVACLGLYGLAAFTAERRTKEIGIRKVMGASISSITTLLSKDFLKLVLVSLVVATPLSYVLMSNWLQGFVYRINMDWWVFLLAGALAIFIAFLTVSYQAVSAALMNPVTSLRSE